MSRIFLLVMVLTVLFISPITFAQEPEETEPEITLTTYYPAPYGDYAELTVSGAMDLGPALNITPTLNATTSGDVLTAVHINPTFNDSTYSNISHNGLIVEDGNVGIGTTAPQERLDIVNASGDGAIKIGNTTETNAGTIRWTGTAFQGYNGTSWQPLGGISAYDTGWINRSDWTTVHLGSSTTKNADSYVAHNLDAPLSELIVKILISTDGTDANSFEIPMSNFCDGNVRNMTTVIFQINANSLKIQTGPDGIFSADDNGLAVPIDSEDWYYKIKVWKLGGSGGG